MALIAGTVSVNADGSAVTTPNTLSKYIYEEFVNNYLIDTGQAMPGGAESVPIKKNFMIQANRFAAAIVTCIKATAEVVGVQTTLSVNPGIQVQGNPFSPSVALTILPHGSGTGSQSNLGQVQ
jgi:hypothetical protein